MKCDTCDTGLISTYETVRYDGRKYAIFICPTCGEENYQEIIQAKPKRRYKGTLADRIAMFITFIVIGCAEVYIFCNLDVFTTIYK